MIEDKPVPGGDPALDVGIQVLPHLFMLVPELVAVDKP
jgi:hypothetical protein